MTRRAVFAFTFVLVLAAVTALVASAQGPNGPSAPGSSARFKADRDHDKLADDLEGSLAGDPRSRRTRVIVTLRAPASADRVRGLESEVGDFQTRRRFSLIPAFAATLTKGQVSEIARDPAVARVDEDSVVHAFNDTAESSFGVTDARVDAGVDGNADGRADTSNSSTGAYSKGDLVAAVIDTGIDAGHKDLDEGKVIGFANCVRLVGPSTCTERAPIDDEGHGTHVAATIAGDGDARADRRYRGVAPGAGLVGVKVLDATGSGRESDVVAGIQWAVTNRSKFGIEALSLSLGAEGCSDGRDPDAQAVNQAFTAGLVVSVAAGNEGPGSCTIGSPGAATGALTVGAMADLGEPDGFYLAEFSSRGPTADGRIKPDISAPGVDITSANGTATKAVNPYVTESGTSMATPFVTGVALLMRDASPSLSSQAVKNDITSTAVDWGRGGNNLTAGSSGRDVDYGAGRLDAYAAIGAAGAAIISPPSVPGHGLRQGSVTDGGHVDHPVDVTSTSFPIAATLIVPAVHDAGDQPDLDLELLDSSGTVVASSERDGTFFPNRQEEIGYRPPATGTYTVRVTSFSGSGSYFVDLSAGAASLRTSGNSGGTPPRSASSPGGSSTGSPASGSPGAASPGADSRAAVFRLAAVRGLRILRRRAIVLRFRPNEAVTARFSATISVPGASRLFRARSVRRSVRANQLVTVRLRLSRAKVRAIARALRRKRRVGATVRIRAVDKAGNVSTRRMRFRVRR